MCPRVGYFLTRYPQSEMIILCISSQRLFGILLFCIEIIAISEFEEFQVGILTVGVMRDTFQTTEQQSLTHCIQICTQRVQQHYQILRRISFHTIIITGACQRIIQNFIETTTGLPDPRREARTTQLFASLGLEPLECTVLTDLAGRVTAAVTLPRTSFTPGECRALAEEMGRICRRDFDPPEVTNCRTVTMLHFGERPLYRAVFGLASRPAPPETVSGDACRQFCDSAGRAQMLLCDGMGTGKPAAVDGQMAAKLTAQLLQAGFAAESAARLVNVALGLKNAGQESGATLDLLTLDLYTGRAGLFKAGAAPSFLCRAGVVRTLDGASLPMGVLPTVTGRSTALTLDVGDTVMMVSDGALCDGSAWLCDQLTLSTRLGQSPQQTAEAVAASAVRRSGARQDDITVAIVRLERQKS